MHAAEPTPPPPPGIHGLNWFGQLNGYQWLVLVAAALGWLFDTMDQQLFVLARTPAIEVLVGKPYEKELITQALSQGKAQAEAEKEAAALTKKLVFDYSNYATAVFIFGWATGGLLFGLFCDRLGRVRTMMLTILLYSIFTGLSAAAQSWIDFAIYRFLTGMGVGGEFAAGVALVAEVMPASVRMYALALLQALSAVGNMMAAVISFIFPPAAFIGSLYGWQWMFLIGIGPAALVFTLMGRLREPETWVRARQAAAMGQREDGTSKQLGDIRDLFNVPRWRHHTIVGVLLAAVGVIGLWGVGFWTPELIRNNVLKDLPKAEQDWYASLASLLQNFGAFFGIYGFGLIAGTLGRRAAFAISYFIGWAAIVLVFGFMTDKSQIWWMSPLLGFCILMVFGGFAVYFPELFPTRLRGTGTGFCYNVARYLAALAPFLLGGLARFYAAPIGTERGNEALSSLTLLSSLGSTDAPFRYATLTVSCVYLVGLITLFFAPETKGQPLPEDDMTDTQTGPVKLVTPDWIALRGGEIRQGLNERTWVIVFDGKQLYRLVATPAGGKFTCDVTLTVSGKRLPTSAVQPTIQAALDTGLTDLRKSLGW